MTMLAMSRLGSRDDCYRELMVRTRGLPNDEILACMIASWASGGGVLPDCLGLAPADFRQLFALHFPGLESIAVHRGTLDPARSDERAALMGLLLHHRAGDCRSEPWLAAILAAACMAGDHLWQDLGLWSRRQLTELMQRNFPALAAQNVKDMKWKKFLYKQLCAAEGLYVCRSPSCELCVDYRDCFGSED